MSFWELEEGGGGIDSFTGIITEAYFSENEYGLSLMLKSTFDEPELFPAKEDGTYTKFLGCGKDWKSQDGGETASHPGGENKRFNKSSKIGQFIEALKPFLAEVAPDFNPYVAKSYKGLHLEWGQVPVEKRRQNPETEKWESYQATELLPVALAGSAAESTPADIGDLGLTDEDQKALAEAATDDAFMKVLLERGLTANTKVMGLVSKDLAGFRAALPF